LNRPALLALAAAVVPTAPTLFESGKASVWNIQRGGKGMNSSAHTRGCQGSSKWKKKKEKENEKEENVTLDSHLAGLHQT
jgi:hypothetical protein